MRRVVCAANKYGDLMVLGARHFDMTMHNQINLSPFMMAVHPASWEQGFIDQRGVFMTREEAWDVAQGAGQILRRVGGDVDRLFSENLY